MPVLLSHNSALELLRSVPPQVRRYSVVDEPLELGQISTDGRFIRSVNFRELGIRRSPLHVLLGKGGRAPRVDGVRCHWLGREVMPGGLLLELAPDVYSAGPELCFIQMCACTSLVGSVMLGSELCGRYSHFSEMISGYYERPPLTCVARINEAIAALMGMYGLSHAREAVRWVCDGSRSPMESVSVAELHLPARYGGLAFIRPELNHEVRLDAAASAIAGTQSCFVDVAWPGQRRGVEYDSKLFHIDPARDLRRREALEHMGWTINTIKLDQMVDHDELMRGVALFEDAIPRQACGPAPPDKVEDLHGRLLRATRYGVGIERALFGVPVPRGAVRLCL